HSIYLLIYSSLINHTIISLHPHTLRTYAVGVLAGARGPQAPENLLFYPPVAALPPQVGRKRKGFFVGLRPSKPPNRVTPNTILACGSKLLSFFVCQCSPFGPTLTDKQ